MECLVCDEETGGEYVMYCPKHKSKKKTIKKKVVLYGFSKRTKHQCRDCGKEINGYRVNRYCSPCYLKRAKFGDM